jgi:hypothetical protein
MGGRILCFMAGFSPGLDMNEPYDFPGPESDTPGTQAPLPVILVYRDHAHERLGRKCLESLSLQLGRQENITVTEWKFEMLASPALRAIAAAEARQARLAVLATGSAGGLPVEVKEWVELWCSTRTTDQGTLVVLLSEQSRCPASQWSDYSYLETKMNSCGTRLEVYVTRWSGEYDDHLCPADARRVTSAGLFIIENFPKVSALLRCPDG